jgi:hypothetical protein
MQETRSSGFFNRLRPPGHAASFLVPSLLFGLSLIGTGWMQLAPRPGWPVIAVFPPWWAASQAVEAVVRADGDIVGLGRWPMMVVAWSSRPRFGQRLRSAGAWLLLDARNSAGCATPALGGP